MGSRENGNRKRNSETQKSHAGNGEFIIPAHPVQLLCWSAALPCPALLPGLRFLSAWPSLQARLDNQLDRSLRTAPQVLTVSIPLEPAISNGVKLERIEIIKRQQGNACWRIIPRLACRSATKLFSPI